MNYFNMEYQKLTQKLIEIAEAFDKWLEEMAEKEGMSKDDVQRVIKDFLQG